MPIDEINDVVMVGGSSRMPKLEQILKEYFGEGITINNRVNPDEVVALGATYLARQLSGHDQGSSIILNDVTPLSIGMQVSHRIEQGFLASIFRGAEYQQLNHKIIKHNTTIPCEKQATLETHEDNQTDFAVKVLEGEGDDAADNTQIAEVIIRGINPAPAGQQKVLVTYNVNVDGILSVTVVNPTTGNAVQTVVNSLNLEEELKLRLKQKALERRNANQ